MNHTRRRITVTLTDDTFGLLSLRARRNGYRSVSAMCSAVLNALAAFAPPKEHTQPIGYEIERMFGEYCDHEQLTDLPPYYSRRHDKR